MPPIENQTMPVSADAVNNSVVQKEPLVQTQLSRNHTRLIVLAVVMILLGLLAYLYFIFQNRQIAVSIQTQNIIATTTDQFAGWQTYTSSQYGFEFLYLPIQHMELLNKINNPLFLGGVSSVSNDVRDNYDPAVSVAIFSYNNSGSDLKMWYEQKLKGNEFFNDKNLNLQQEQISSREIAGHSALEVQDVSYGVLLDRVYIPSGSVVVRIGSDSNYLNQILSTFKFISTSTIPTIGTSTPDTINKSDAQQGSYKPGSVVVILKVGVNQTNFDKFIKNYNLKILSEVKGVYVEIGVPDGKEQIFVNLFESVSGVESAMLNSRPSLTN